MLEQGALTREKLNQLLRHYVIEELDYFDQLQAEGRPRNPDAHEEELEAIEIALDEARNSFSERNHVRHASRQVDFLLDEAGLTLDKGGEDYKRLCWEVLKAHISVLEANKNRIMGNYRGTDPGSVMSNLGINAVLPGPVRKAAPAPGEDGGAASKPTIKLAQLIADYQTRQLESNKWTEGTVRNHTPKLRALVQFIGDRPVNKITIDQMREYAKVLELLPDQRQL